MAAQLDFLEEWLPERMAPGSVFVLTNRNGARASQLPYAAVVACPRCGELGLITRRQFLGVETMICCSEDCSAECRVQGEHLEYRKPQ